MPRLTSHRSLCLLLALGCAGLGHYSHSAGPVFQRITVSLEIVLLTGREGAQSLIVTGETTDGWQHDLTRQATYRLLDPKVAVLSAGAVLHPLADGETQVEVTAGGQSVRVPVQVQRADESRPIQFEQD